MMVWVGYNHCTILQENSTLTRRLLCHYHPFGTTSHFCSTFVVDLPHPKFSKMQPHCTAVVYHINIYFQPEKLIKILQEFGYILQEIQICTFSFHLDIILSLLSDFLTKEEKLKYWNDRENDCGIIHIPVKYVSYNWAPFLIKLNSCLSIPLWSLNVNIVYLICQHNLYIYQNIIKECGICKPLLLLRLDYKCSTKAFSPA